MTVLQIIKDLISEEDVNFGDSDTTFARQTHTGGSVNVHYVDSKSIPSNALGGVIDDHIHAQNTDTGTTGVTFTLNSGGNYIMLNTAGNPTNRVFTFPTDADQQLAGRTDMASTANGYGASRIGVEDAGGFLAAGNVEAALAELATEMAAVSTYIGYKRGFLLSHSSVTTVNISGGMWDHRGTTDRSVYTDEQTAFVTGSAGSNADSDDLGADEIHYLYVDDSAVVSSGSSLLTASEFINDTTEPAWNNAKVGWYNGNDRCIGAVLTSGASLILPFKVFSDNFFGFISVLTEVFADAAAPTVLYGLSLAAVVPVFSTRARLRVTATTDEQEFAFAPGATEPATDFFVAATGNDAYYSIDTLLSDTQATHVICSVNGNMNIYVSGFYMNEL